MKVTLKALRVMKGLKQSEVAKKVGVSTVTWRSYEYGRTFPDVPVIEEIERFFDVHYDDINFLTKNAV